MCSPNANLNPQIPDNRKLSPFHNEPAGAQSEESDAFQIDYKCKTCGKELTRNYYESDTMFHICERPYKCTLCAKTFLSRDALEHCKTMHARLRSYEDTIQMVIDQSRNIMMLNEDESVTSEDVHADMHNERNISKDSRKMKLNEVQSVASMNAHTELNNARGESAKKEIVTGKMLTENHRHPCDETSQIDQDEIAKEQLYRKCTICTKQIIEKNFEAHVATHQRKRDFNIRNRRHTIAGEKSSLDHHDSKNSTETKNDPFSDTAPEILQSDLKPQNIGKMKIECLVCGKFISRYNFTRHFKLHDRERMFPCGNCQELFSDRAKCEKHHMSVHPEKRFFVLRMTEVRETETKELNDDIVPDKRRKIEAEIKIEETVNVEFDGGTALDRKRKIPATDVIPDKRRNSSQKEPGEDIDIVKRIKTLTTKNNGPIVHGKISETLAVGEKIIQEKRMRIPTRKKNEMIIHERGRKTPVKELDKKVILDEKRKTHNKKIVRDNASSKKDMKKHECGECGKTFAREHNFVNHKRSHTAEKPYKCEDCEKTFISVQRLTAHNRTHPVKSYPYVCDVCGESFTGSFDYEMHLQNHKEIQPHYTCNECGKTFARNTNYQTHLKTHVGGNPYKCDSLKRSYGRISSDTIHKRGEMRRDEIHVNNPYADKNFFAESQEKPNPIFTCKVCGTTFPQDHEYQIHLITHEERNADFSRPNNNNDENSDMEICTDYVVDTLKETNESQNNIISTDESKQNENQSIYAYSISNNFFSEILQPHTFSHDSNESDYATHSVNGRERISHEQIKEIDKSSNDVRDNECDTIFNSEKTVQKTQPSYLQHENNQIYVCKYCDRFFTRNSTYNTHLKTHSGPNPYTCDIWSANSGKRMMTHPDQNDQNLEKNSPMPSNSERILVDITENDFDTFAKEYMQNKLFICKTCGQGFDREAELDVHKIKHVESSRGSMSPDFLLDDGEDDELQNYVKCHLCKKSFFKDYFKQHLDKHKNLHKDLVECHLCKKKFFKEFLKRHLETHVRKSYECEVCLIRLDNEQNYKMHIRVHTGCKPHSCFVCGESFACSDSLENHECVAAEKSVERTQDKKSDENYMIVSTDDVKFSEIDIRSKILYECGQCGEKSINRNLFLKHVKTHVEQKRCYRCSKCDKTYQRIKHYETHLKKHMDEDMRMFMDEEYDNISIDLLDSLMCELCGQTFETSEKYSCHECPPFEPSTNDVTEQLNLPSQLHDNMYKSVYCESCGEPFVNNDNFFNHACSEIRPMQCDICGEVLVGLNDFEKHICDLSEPTFVMCDLCGRVFVNISVLEKHFCDSAEIKPLICDICNKCFETDDELAEHSCFNEGQKRICESCGEIYDNDHKCSDITLNESVCDVRDNVGQLTNEIISHETYAKLCESCGTMHKNEELEKHICLVSENVSLDCSFCGGAFDNKSDLENHCCIYTGTCSVTCKDCNRTFDEVQYNSHVCTKLRSDNLRLFEQEVTLPIQNHYSLRDMNFPEYDNSGRSNEEGIDYLLRNENVCDIPSPLRCPECGQVLQGARSINDHKCSLLDEKQSIICVFCGNVAADMAAYAEHICKHDNKTYLKCNECGLTYEKKIFFVAHMLGHRDKKNCYRCNICGESFLYKYHCQEHCSTHKNKNNIKETKDLNHDCSEENVTEETYEQMLPCNICEKLFAREIDFKKHVLAHPQHVNEITGALSRDGFFMCTICNQRMDTKIEYEKHIKQHASKWFEACKICGKKFDKYYIKVHMRLHADGKMLKCEVCSKSFTQHSTYKRHACLHKGSELFKCKECGKIFVCKDSYAMHVSTHAVKNLHKCIVCNATFPLYSKYQKHLQQHVEESNLRSALLESKESESRKIDSSEVD